MIFSNQKTIFFKIGNTKVGHILRKSMTHSLYIQYMCKHSQQCILAFILYRVLIKLALLDATFDLMSWLHMK